LNAPPISDSEELTKRYLGRVTDWNEDKGFGFVTPNGGGERAPVRGKALKRPTRASGPGRRPR